MGARTPPLSRFSTARLAAAIALCSLGLLGALLPTAIQASGPSAVAGAADAGCGTKRIGEIAVATLNGVPLVTLLGNGVPVNLLLDTDAERTILTKEIGELDRK